MAGKDKKAVTIICMGCEVKLDTEHTGVKCPNNHHICSECSENYVKQIFEISQFPPKCQQCHSEVYVNSFTRQLNQDLHDIFLLSMTTNEISEDEEIKNCPFCKYFEVWAKSNTSNFFQCKTESCGKGSCTICFKEIKLFGQQQEYTQELIKEIEEDVQRHYKCQEFKPMKDRFEDIIENSVKASCPKCGIKGMKDDACTHMTCDNCCQVWCYTCGKAVEEVDKEPGRDNIQGHNVNWKTNPDRCPMFLLEIAAVDDRWDMYSDEVALEFLHRQRMLMNLKAFVKDVSEEGFLALQEVFPSVESCGFTLEQILCSDDKLIIRNRREQREVEEARAKAEAEAKARQEARETREREAREKAAAEARRKEAEEAKAKAEEEARVKAAAEARAKEEEEARRKQTQMALDITCDICFEEYDETEHKPKMLFCGHTLCHVCIGTLYQGNQEVQCPKCMQVHAHHPDQFAVNWYLLEVIRRHKESMNSFNSGQVVNAFDVGNSVIKQELENQASRIKAVQNAFHDTFKTLATVEITERLRPQIRENKVPEIVRELCKFHKERRRIGFMELEEADIETITNQVSNSITRTQIQQWCSDQRIQEVYNYFSHEFSNLLGHEFMQQLFPHARLRKQQLIQQALKYGLSLRTNLVLRPAEVTKVTERALADNAITEKICFNKFQADTRRNIQVFRRNQVAQYNSGQITPFSSTTVTQYFTPAPEEIMMVKFIFTHQGAFGIVINNEVEGLPGYHDSKGWMWSTNGKKLFSNSGVENCNLREFPDMVGKEVLMTYNGKLKQLVISVGAFNVTQKDANWPEKVYFAFTLVELGEVRLLSD